jgi:N-acetylglucosaminyl-diphospho-decaprenol L-rhamnosyltransferase
MLLEDVSVVVVTFRSRDVVAECLESLREPNPGAITVVDNASKDGTAELVRERFPLVRVLEVDRNIGFGAAANAGVETVESPYVLVLNPDARPLHGALSSLRECAAEHADAAIVVPALVDETGRPQPSRVGYPTPRWTGAPALTSFPRARFASRDRGFAVGAALLFRREAFRSVGGFDPDYFLFYEEVDLCLRLEEAGWAIASCRAATFRHVGGASTRRNWPESYRRQLAGHLRFIRKHYGGAAAERSRRILLVAVALRALLSRGELRTAAREAAPWLRGHSVSELLD